MYDNPTSWDLVRRYGRMAAVVRKRKLKKALLQKAWIKAQVCARKEREMSEGIVFGESEKEWKKWQEVTDQSENSNVWEWHKSRENEFWRKMDEERKQEDGEKADLKLKA